MAGKATCVIGSSRYWVYGMNNEFSDIEQLRWLLSKFPDESDKYTIKINIYGTILDYIGRTKETLSTLFVKYPSLYDALFRNSNRDTKETSKLIRALVYDEQVRRDVSIAAKERGWTELENVISVIDMEESQKCAPRHDNAADRLAGHRVDGVIWQLSDIHFGKFNSLGLTASQLADNLYDIVNSTYEFEPRLIVVSGDISSTAARDNNSEFDQFQKFCQQLSERLWGTHRPYRFLVVPGNHETTWLSDGCADYLEGFRTHIDRGQKVITPFWTGSNPRMMDNDVDIYLESYIAKGRPEVQPFVLIYERNLDIRFMLLISSYYSGLVPEPVRKVLGEIGHGLAVDRLHELLREDKGEIKDEYLSHIRNYLQPIECPTIAVTHHNLAPYGQQTCQTANAKELLSTLHERQALLVWHGHTHLIEEQPSHRAPVTSEAYPIPCPTLCSDPTPGSRHGFMMHLIGPKAQPRRITTAVWEINLSKKFKPDPERLRVQHRFRLYRNRLELVETQDK